MEIVKRILTDHAAVREGPDYRSATAVINSQRGVCALVIVARRTSQLNSRRGHAPSLGSGIGDRDPTHSNQYMLFQYFPSKRSEGESLRYSTISAESIQESEASPRCDLSQTYLRDYVTLAQKNEALRLQTEEELGSMSNITRLTIPGEALGNPFPQAAKQQRVSGSNVQTLKVL